MLPYTATDMIYAMTREYDLGAPAQGAAQRRTRRLLSPSRRGVRAWIHSALTLAL